MEIGTSSRITEGKKWTSSSSPSTSTEYWHENDFTKADLAFDAIRS